MRHKGKAQAKRLLSGSSVAADLQASVQCHCRTHSTAACKEI